MSSRVPRLFVLITLTAEVGLAILTSKSRSNHKTNKFDKNTTKTHAFEKYNSILVVISDYFCQ
jgi:hypothetical protein